MKTHGILCFVLITALLPLGSVLAQPPSAGLQLWLRADALTGLNNGDKVASWNDVSGRGNDATNPEAANQPTYVTGALNGLPVVRFADGGNAANAGQYLDSLLTLNANGAPFSVFAVFKSEVSATARDTILQPLNDGVVNNGRTVLYLENDVAAQYRLWTFASATNLIGLRPYCPGTWAVVSLVQDPGANRIEFWRAGAFDGSTNLGPFTTPNGPWRIGDNKPRNGGLQGDIAEILIYDAALSAADREAVESYLLAKYGLATPTADSPECLFRDNFNVSAPSNDVNFENSLGRQSGSAGVLAYLENGVPDALTQLNNPASPGMLRLEANGTYNYTAVTPDRNFTDGGRFNIEFDVDAGVNDPTGSSGDWACVVFGATTRGPAFVNASDGMGILFRNNGPIQVFDGPTDTHGGAMLPLGLLHVRIEVSTADFQGGSPATIRMFVNDTPAQLGATTLEYVKPDGFRGNYVTLGASAFGGNDWVHVFDNLIITAQPCIRPSPAQVVCAVGQTNQVVTVAIPSSLSLTSAVEVIVTSSAPSVAEPLGAGGDTLTLTFPPGVTVRTFNVAGLAHGSAVFTLTGPAEACTGGTVTVSVGPTLVLNPSFEENYNPTWPHYGAINQWQTIPGGNPGVNDASGPFHDNSVIPDQDRVALYQGTGGISQMIGALVPGQQYWLQFRYNKRNGGLMALSTRFDGAEIDFIPSIPVAGPVAGSGEYHFRNVVFTPASDSGLLEFRTIATGDATVLLDAVTIVPRGTNQIVVQNPSFEASGDVTSPGVLTNRLAGWTGTGTFGVNRNGQDYADVGQNPDQDHVAFIQGVGSLSQIVSNLTVGQPYQIQFAASARSTDSPWLRLSVDGVILYENPFNAVGPGEPYPVQSVEWLASATTAEIKFETLDDIGGTLLLDDVQVTGLALPPPETRLSVQRVEFFAGQPLGPSNVVVTLPRYLIATQAFEVLVVSLDLTVAVPVGGAGGTLSLLFTPGGTNSLSFDIATLGSGTVTFLITNQTDWPSAQLIVRNRRSLVLNPSFEDNSQGGVGYGEIVEWTGGSGVNTATQPFADNGLIPDRGQIAFIQGGYNALGQTIYGLDTNKQYWVQAYVNARNCCGDVPLGTIHFNGVELVTPTQVPPVGVGSAYYFVNVPFTPNSPTGALELISLTTAANGDRTLLLDAVTLVAREPGQIVLQNPSFEGSGNPAWPGYVSLGPLAGWAGAGGYGVNISGAGPFADNGVAPDQDNVAFLQGQGSSLSQTVSGLSPGARYTLSYAYNARNGSTPQLTVSAGGEVIQDEVIAPVGANNPYLVKTATFVASAESITISFIQSAADDQTVLLDDVKLAEWSPFQVKVTIQVVPVDSVRISWPLWAGPDWVLQSSATLPGTFQDTGLPVGTEGEEYVVYDSTLAGNNFYRLLIRQ